MITYRWLAASIVAATLFTGAAQAQTPPSGPGDFPPVSLSGGDICGTYPVPKICKIQGFAVSNATPTSNQVLAWSSGASQWVPVSSLTLASLTLSPAVNTTALTLSGASHTGSDATSDVSLATTLNTSASPDVFKIAATVTAAGASTKLLNIYAGAGGLTSVFSVDKFGNTLVPADSTIGTVSNSRIDFASNNSVVLQYLGTNIGLVVYTGGALLSTSQGINWGNQSNLGSIDLTLTRAGPAIIHHGAADAAAPVQQTVGFQGVVAGTSNTAGANAIFAGSQGTGTGVGGSLIFQTAPAGSSGTAQNALATVLTLDSTKLATFTGQIAAANMTQTSTAQSGTVCQGTTLTYDASVGCLTSAETLKDISGTIPHPLATILTLRPIAYTWRPEAPRYRGDPGNHWGLGAYATAYEGEELIARDGDGNPRGWRTDAMIATAVGAIQELDARVTKLSPSQP